MNDLHGDPAEDVGLNARELIALEQYYLGEEDRRTRQLSALEDKLAQRMEALEALEAKLTQGLNAVQDLEARLKKELDALDAERRDAGPIATPEGTLDGTDPLSP